MVQQTTDREHVAWDIETTGFAWDSETTVAELWYPAGHADLLLNAPEDAVDTDALEDHLEACSGGVPVTVGATEDEASLLKQCDSSGTTTNGRGHHTLKTVPKKRAQTGVSNERRRRKSPPWEVGMSRDPQREESPPLQGGKMSTVAVSRASRRPDRPPGATPPARGSYRSPRGRRR